MAGFSLLNLALVEGTKVDAASCAMELDERDLPESSISDACAIIRQWAKTRPQREILTARETLEHLDPGASKTARRVKESYD
jgi:hypothetical protein